MSNTQTAITFSRAWSMPSPDTFGMVPVGDLLDRWIGSQMEVVDPFARNSKWGTLTNDLNPKTDALHHMPAEDFCTMLAGRRISADAVLFDPPYSPRQIAEVYQQIGRQVTTRDTQNARLYREVKDGLANILNVGGIAICCGWNSAGFGTARGFELIEILLVAHGGAHNDTIVTVERKVQGTFALPGSSGALDARSGT